LAPHAFSASDLTTSTCSIAFFQRFLSLMLPKATVAKRSAALAKTIFLFISTPGKTCSALYGGRLYGWFSTCLGELRSLIGTLRAAPQSGRRLYIVLNN